MSQVSPRILELRRRLQADPASIAFAQLAEEYRRAGEFDDAIRCCREGLARHPGYHSARVTLARALSEIDQLDDAAREFEIVLRNVPDNLAARRGLEEIDQRRGAPPRLDERAQPAPAVDQGAALDSPEPSLTETLSRIARGLGHAIDGDASRGERAADPDAPGEGGGGDRASQPAVTDFDALLRALGVPDASPPPATERLLDANADAPLVESILPPEVPADAAADDPFAVHEEQLRAAFARREPGAGYGDPLAEDVGEEPDAIAAGAATDRDHTVDEAPARASDTASAGAAPQEPSDEVVLEELEQWLATIVAERRDDRSPDE